MYSSNTWFGFFFLFFFFFFFLGQVAHRCQRWGAGRTHLEPPLGTATVPPGLCIFMPQFRKHAALPLRSLLSLSTHLQRGRGEKERKKKKSELKVNFPSQVTSPLKVQWTRIVSSGKFGLAMNTEPKDGSRSRALPVPRARCCFSRANARNRSPGTSPPYSLGTLGLRHPLGTRASGGCQTPVQSGSRETQR